ncbi:MAG TPA: hypothetical protein VGF12_11115 [Roseateles sp.]|uniref:S9 family peptidase n=1 Tax=Roseateles sp. TaxID=1971397 RepID=UPI002EDA5233
MRLLLLAPVSALIGIASSVAAIPPSEGPSVRDIVEFTKIVQPMDQSSDGLRRQVSPDGSRVFFVTRRSHVATDRNRYEIQLLALDPVQLKSGHPAAPRTVFTFESDDDHFLEDMAVRQVRWHDDRTLLFIGRMEDGVNQAYRLDVPTGQVTRLTHETTPVVSFEIDRDQRRMVYAVQVPNPPMKDGAKSIVIGNQSFWSVKWGQQRLISQLRKYRFYVADLGSAAKPRALGEPFFEANIAKPTVSISPDGRWAVLPHYDRDRTLAWSREYPLLGEVVARFARNLEADPLNYYSNTTARTARRMTAWRLDDGHEQTIVDAPDDAMPGSPQYRSDRLWQGQGESVVLAGTHLPKVADAGVSTASHVIEYWPESRRWRVIAEMAGRVASAVPTADGFVVVDGDKRRRFRRLDAGGWREINDVGAQKEAARSAWVPRIQQALNEPPDVVAEGPSGQAVRLTQLNPQFSAKTWGAMKTYAWSDAKGREWVGGLMGREGAAGQGRLPLVIQNYTYDPKSFYLDGPNALGGFSSAYPGRAFVREGILVLAMSYQPRNGAIATDRHGRLVQYYEGVRAAVDSLVKDGLVDPARVGIIGFSYTGELTLNLVTFSDVPIRAATLADGDTNTLFNYAVGFGFGFGQNMETANRGVPFGPTRDQWLRNDPALNTDCVRAALRIESYGAPVYGNYDIYALLRRQYKPVEMVLIPGGFHSLSAPSERMISLQGNVDWYRYWLKGERRTTPFLAGETAASLQAQYESWDQMEKMKVDVDAKPRCAREPSRG